MQVTGQDISRYLERLKSARVLCIGDVMLDRFCEGAVVRLSPEAPIPVLHVSREEAHLGGAGNVARNLSALFVCTNLISICGDDASGRELEFLLQNHPGIHANLNKLSDRPTIIKTRFVANGQQLLRADWEKVAPVPEQAAATIMAQVLSELPHVGAVILSDYGKGVLSANLIRDIIEKAKIAKVPVIVDPKGDDFSCYAGASVVTPNRRELARASRMPVQSEAEVVGACEYLMQSCSISGVLATRSEHGMSLIFAGQEPHHLNARAREVFDVAGAGDTVIATFAAGVAAGLSLQEAAWLANVAAGIVVAKVGTAVAFPDEIIASVHKQSRQEGEDKVVSLDTALARVQRWRQEGLKIGFTNGCFDLLHPGHISLIEQAAVHCDRLIVGLNSDRSVQRLKGDGRPVQNEVSRATVLASLAKVSMVVFFSEDTPLDLIRAIKPDVLVKGADYTLETVVGATDVRSWGGEVVLADMVQGQSTSDTIAKMKI